MGAIPSGTVTLLFTDIEGSSRAWEEHPAQMRSALVRHDELVRAAVVRNGGHVFKTVGDAFCVVFADAADAARAAVDVQRCLATERWPTAALIRVRIALHSGACDERDGDYFGPTVNRVARLLALAHGGQTVVSGVAAALLSDRLDRGVTLRDLGDHALKDLERSERIWQVVADGLEVTFPPLRSLEGARERHNLPEQVTTFVGRATELEQIGLLLQRAKVVTLVGPGGAGKTRLALEIAARQIGTRADGVWLAELAAVLDARNVARAIAAAVGVREQPSEAPIATVTEALRARDLLLVVDNCEHVVEAAAEAVDAIGRSCRRVIVLATSREPLAVAGEHVVRVAPMPLPAPGERDPEQVAGQDAVKLFVDRVRLHDATFEVNRSSAPAVARICRRLDGIPLALELAAARARALTVGELDDRLGERLRVLAMESRVGSPRQRTLHATLDWSFELLTPRERVLFTRLSVFVGGWDFPAAEGVCAGRDLAETGIWELLSMLVTKSLVEVERSSGGIRYALLETMRAYALERLHSDGRGTGAALRWAHLDHYAGVAEAAGSLLNGARGRAAMDQLAQEHENMRAALSTSLEFGRIDAGLRICVALAGYWRARGFQREGAEWLSGLLTHPLAHNGTLLHGEASSALGFFLIDLGRFSEGGTHLEAAIAAARVHGDAPLGIRSRAQLAFLRCLEGDSRASLALARDAVTAARSVGDPELVALALARQADAYDVAGDLDRTRELLEEALVVARTTQNQTLLCSLLNNTGEAALYFDDLDVARGRFEECAALTWARDDRYVLAYAQRNLATALVRMGNAELADSVSQEALELAERAGGPREIAYALLCRAHISSAHGDALRAAVLDGAADAVFAEIGVAPEHVEERLQAEGRARLRDVLGDDGFQKAYERGRSLSREDAIAFARESREAQAVSTGP